MEITYIGHSCFKIKGKTTTLIIDPYDPKIGYRMPKQEADILLVTHDHYDHNNVEAVSGFRLLVDSPGEYEASDVFITGLPTYHDDKGGKERGKNIVYLIEMEGIVLLHLGDLGQELGQSTLEEIDIADVLMIPVGGKYTLDAEKAAKVISSIEPGVVIPMHYKTDDLKGIPDIDTLDKFLDEMGVEDSVKRVDKLKINSKSDIPAETEVVILQPNH